MAKTYYNFQDRGFDNQVDWTAIGKTMSDMLIEQTRLREEKKESLDEASRNYMEELSAPPEGKFVDGNEAILKYSNEAMKYHLMQNRLLKSGTLDPGKYVINRQNNETATKKIFEVGKKFQEEYDRKLERWKNRESQAVELKAMEMGEKFSQWKNSEININPENGQAVVTLFGEPDKDGIKKRLKTMTVQQFGNLVSHDFDRFKTSEWLTQKEATVGEFITRQEQLTGKALSMEWIDVIKDKTKRNDGIGKAWDQYVTETFNELLVNPNDGASVLTDTIGGYDPVLSEDETKGEDGKRDQSKILYENDGYGVWRAVLTDKQEEELKGFVDRQLTVRVDKEVKPQGVNRRPQWRSQSSGGGSGSTSPERIVTLLGDLYSGTERKKNVASQALRGFTGGAISRVESDGNNIVVYFDDENRQPEPIQIRDKQGNIVKTEGEFIQAAWNLFAPKKLLSADPLEYYKDQGARYNPVNYENAGAILPPATEAYKQVLLDRYPGTFNTDMFVSDGEWDTKGKIEDAFNTAGIPGFTVEQADRWGNDAVIIKDPLGVQVAKFELDASDGFNTAKSQEYLNRILEIAAEYADEDEVQEAVKGRRSVTGSTTGAGAAGSLDDILTGNN